MKTIVDVCCGGKMFYFNKEDERVLFLDNRLAEKGHNEYRPNHSVEPDMIMDFTNLQFKDESFRTVIFDPPHMKGNPELNISKLYGYLDDNWDIMIKKGFEECFRVLEKNGILIFKWNETSIPISKVLPLIPKEQFPPLLGNKAGTKLKTHWLIFSKR